MEFASRQLRAFHLVAERRNFTRAAEALFLTPSGLRVLIRELERQLGFRLFDRTTRQVVLPAQGSELVEVARLALTILEEGMVRIGHAVNRKSLRISVGTTPWLAAHVLPAAIREFRDWHLHLQIHLFALWLPIRCEKGLKPPLLATRIRRKCPVSSAGYELLSKLQNLYALVRFRRAPPILRSQNNRSRTRVPIGLRGAHTYLQKED
jgi:hypothetical protein